MTISSNHQYWSLADRSPYWLQEYDNEGNEFDFQYGVVDNNQNIYMAAAGAGGTDELVFKSNINGYEQWTANCSGPAGSRYPIGDLVSVSDGNIYTANGQKINSASGAAVWAYTYTINGNLVLTSNADISPVSGAITGAGVAAGSSTQTIVAGPRFNTFTPPSYWQKYFYAINQNTSGTVQWIKQFYLSSYCQPALYQPVAMDTNSNVVVGGNMSSSPQVAFVTQLDSTGAVNWQRQLNSSTSGYDADVLGGVVCDSNNNVYVAVLDAFDNSTNIVKFNSTGTLQWQRKIYDAVTSAHYVFGKTIQVDSAGTVYLSAAYHSPTDQMIIASWNTSGVLQWQNALINYGPTAYQVEPGFVAPVPGLNDIVFSTPFFQQSGSPGTGAFFMRAPNNGHLQFQRLFINETISYETSYLTEAAGALTVAVTSAPTVTAPGYSQTSQTFTTSNVGPTHTRVAMP